MTFTVLIVVPPQVTLTLTLTLKNDIYCVGCSSATCDGRRSLYADSATRRPLPCGLRGSGPADQSAAERGMVTWPRSWPPTVGRGGGRLVGDRLGVGVRRWVVPLHGQHGRRLQFGRNRARHLRSFPCFSSVFFNKMVNGKWLPIL